MAKSLTTKITTNKKNKVLVLFLCFFFTFMFFEPSSAQDSTKARLVSISGRGAAGNNAASQASISNDGRFVAFISEADNLVPNDNNHSTDVFVHDRLTSTTERVSISSTGEQANGNTSKALISGNGRYVIFESSASNLATISDQGKSAIFLHDRLTHITEKILSPGKDRLSFTSIAANGRYLTLQDPTEIYIYDALTHFAFAISNFSAPLPAPDRAVQITADGRSLLYADQDGNLQLYNRVLSKTQKITKYYPNGAFALSANAHKVVVLSEDRINIYTSIPNQPGSLHKEQISRFSETQNIYSPAIALSDDGNSAIALSDDGNYLIIHHANEKVKSALLGYDLTAIQTHVLATDILSDRLSLSGDGNSIAYAQEFAGIPQIFVLDRVQISPSYILSGRVIDESGLPLALVTLQDSHGNIVKTDRQGNFWINGLSPGPVTLTASKEGYSFNPVNASVKVSSDISNTTFIVSHDEVLRHAQLDIGMPYNFERGCETPWQGCGGEFHGFSSGYCTDLILDAYLWGADFNIQTALIRDYQTNPEHFYRWRNARNAHDMWRYFSYSGQIFPHAVGYLPGDIVFFDWSGDGEIDHVSIISEINGRNRPSKIYDSTGVIPTNPSGLANELPWEAFHEDTVRGHARWTGIYGASNTVVPMGNYLQIAVASANIRVTVFDSQGNRLDQSVRNIPNSTFFNLGWEQSMNIGAPQTNSNYYIVQISSLGADEINYQFIAHTIQEGLVTARVENSLTLLSDSTNTIYLHLSNNAVGELELDIVRGILKIREPWED
jgi:hypothetical protein